jgi:hypothetical protein
MLADFDPLVTGIAAQPFLLTGPDQDRTRRHVPDLLLVHADGGVRIVDVKAPSRMTDDRVREQFAWTERVCAGRGWVFESWSGTDPRLLANVRFLAGYRRRAFIDAELAGAVLVPRRDSRRPGRSSAACRHSIRQRWSGRQCCTCCGRAGCRPT